MLAPSNFGEWLAWGGIFVPLAAIAWSAVCFVQNQRREQRFREFQKFHELMRELGTAGTTVLGNAAVAYELRKFPQYREVIVRSLVDVEVRGTRADLLKREFALTIEFLENGK